MPAADTESFQIFVDILARKFSRQHILLILDGAPNHTTDDLVIPTNITLEFLPPYSPELNPQENIWDEIREKIFKNYALKQGLRQARGGDTLHRTQSKDCQIHHVISIHYRFTVICKWYKARSPH